MVESVNSVKQNSTLGSMAKAGAIGAGVAGLAKTADLYYGASKAIKNPGIITDTITLAQNYQKGSVPRKFIASGVKFLKAAVEKGSMPWKKALPKVGIAALTAGVIAAGITGIVNLIKSDGNK